MWVSVFEEGAERFAEFVPVCTVLSDCRVGGDVVGLKEGELTV